MCVCVVQCVHVWQCVVCVCACVAVCVCVRVCTFIIAILSVLDRTLNSRQSIQSLVVRS